MQTILPTVGPGALQNREDATHKASKVSKGRVSFCGIFLRSRHGLVDKPGVPLTHCSWETPK